MSGYDEHYLKLEGATIDKYIGMSDDSVRAFPIFQSTLKTGEIVFLVVCSDPEQNEGGFINILSVDDE